MLFNVYIYTHVNFFIFTFFFKENKNLCFFFFKHLFGHLLIFYFLLPTVIGHLVNLLVSAAAQEKAQKLQRLESDQLTLGRHQFEHATHSVFHVERRYHGRRLFGHERHKRLENVVQVFVLVNCTR